MWKDKPAFFAAVVMAAGFAAARATHASIVVWAICAIVCLPVSIVSILRARRRTASEYFSFSIPILLFCSSALWYCACLEFESDHIVKFLHIGRPLRLVCRVADEPVLRNGRVQLIVNVLSLGLEDDSIAVQGNALLTVIQDRRDGDDTQRADRRFASRVRKLGAAEPKFPDGAERRANGADGSATDTANFSYGDVIGFTALLEEPQETRNPGEVSYRDYLALNNVYAVARVRGFNAITVMGGDSPHWLFERGIYPAKRFVSRSIDASAGGDEARYLTGLLLGDRTDISKEIQQAFANTGTIHILAVSGSHVVVIVAAIYALFGMLRIPPRLKIVATIGAILFYMALTGASPSVVRATLMAGVVLAGKLFQRRSSVYNCLGVSAVLMFIYDPKQVFDVGFQLSFSAVFSMVFFYPRLTAWTSVIPKTPFGRTVLAAAELTAVSAAAQIGTIPFTAYYFEKVSMISLFANLLVVPLAGLNITIGFVSVLFSIVSSWVGSCFTEVNALLAHLVLAAVKASNQVPFAIVHTASFGARETFLYAVAAAMAFNINKPLVFKKLLLVMLMAVDCLLIAGLFSQQPRLMRVTFFDVGQGDAALVEFPGVRPMMIDAGPRTALYDAGEKVLVPGLRRRGVNRLSAALITHAHDDHIGGMPAVLSEIGADRLLASSVPVVDALQKPGISLTPDSIQHIHTGDMVTVHPGARIYVLHPPHEAQASDAADPYAASNNSSVVLRICYGKISFLLMGDAERTVEAGLVERYGGFLRSTVVKLGHHGSGTSSSEKLLRAAAPDEAVIMVGRFNVFRHPSPSTLRLLQRLGIRTHRTDREGAVVYETDGESLHWVAWRDDVRMHGLLR